MIIRALHRIRRAIGMVTWPRRSLRTHFVLVVLIALLPALMTTIAFGIGAIQRAQGAVDLRLREMARIVARDVDRDLGTLIGALESMPDLTPHDPNDSLTRLRRRAAALARSTGDQIWIYDADGRRRADTADIGGPDGAPDLPAALAGAVVRSGASTVANLTTRAAPRRPLPVLIVKLSHGFDAALLVLSLARTLTNDLQQDPQPRADQIIAVLDDEGLLSASARPLPGESGLHIPAPAALGTNPGPAPIEPHRIDGRVYLVTRAPLAQAPGWQVLYGEDVATLDAARILPLLGSASATLLAGGLSVLLAWLLGARLALPLRLLASQARTVAIGAAQPRDQMRPSTITEFETLRVSMARADAVLRRRAAAERMALREARTGHELLVSVVNAAAESIAVKNTELRYVLVNQAALLEGPEPLEEWQMLGRTTADLLPPEIAERMVAADRAVLANGRLTSLEFELPQPDGTSRWRWVTATPWRNADGEIVGVVTLSRDVTERRAAGRRLRGLQADLLRATRLSAMGAMAGGLAHEINQPLAAASNYVNAARRLLGRGQAGETGALDAAGHAAADAAQQLLRAGAIVRRLRDFVERGEAQLEPEDAGDLIREACDLARGDGLAAGIELRVSIGTSAPGPGADDDGTGQCRILADRTQLQQVLLNLIRNASEAIAAHGARGPDLTLAPPDTPAHPGLILVSANTRTEGVVITVSDNGPGIESAIAERLFQPFVSTKSSGMGIGLVICRTIIEGHGGELTAGPGPLGGSEFRIVLPVPRPAGD